MQEINIRTWVEQAPPNQQSFREAVHIILDGIGHSQNLNIRMVMKGGLLLAIRYESSRFTSDIDFSTPQKYSPDTTEALLQELRDGLIAAGERLPYGTQCRLQSYEVQPKGLHKTHQSLALKIGYAEQSHSTQMARLNAGTAARVVAIDYSFNEAVFDVEILELDGGATIHSYSLVNILAEKMRSLLQQPIRKRTRRQDVYDIWLLLESEPEPDSEMLAKLHQIFVDSCKSKGIIPDKDSMESPEVRAMASKDYATLASDIAGELPPFEQAMARVIKLYRSMPW